MKDVWVAGDVIVSPLGKTSEENFSKLSRGISGLNSFHDDQLSASPIVAGKISDVPITSSLTRFETLCVDALTNIVGQLSFPPEKTVLILSTTKGNHLVISNACISGVVALMTAARFLRAGLYDHAVVLGADALSRFVVSGFQSLAALSDEPCKPFDANRKGINLGEAAAAMLLTSKPETLGVRSTIKILGGGLTNDANHISGPSRTGEELAMAIGRALSESDISASSVDFISAHGTATLYNDEMEAKAFHWSGLDQTPLNSLKGYFGHTLGAAGVVESVVSIYALKNNMLIPTLGFEAPGVSKPVHVITKQEIKPMTTCLKTASGFGGCNAALVFQKTNT
ncbi:MAG: beta-ketoacyl-[acyl-carrier-protein] synthase family protein [Bacteroidota bacterium]